jgi:hypothetical protein
MNVLLDTPPHFVDDIAQTVTLMLEHFRQSFLCVFERPDRLIGDPPKQFYRERISGKFPFFQDYFEAIKSLAFSQALPFNAQLVSISTESTITRTSAP